MQWSTISSTSNIELTNILLRTLYFLYICSIVKSVDWICLSSVNSKRKFVANVCKKKSKTNKSREKKKVSSELLIVWFHRSWTEPIEFMYKIAINSFIQPTRTQTKNTVRRRITKINPFCFRNWIENTRKEHAKYRIVFFHHHVHCTLYSVCEHNNVACASTYIFTLSQQTER